MSLTVAVDSPAQESASIHKSDVGLVPCEKLTLMVKRSSDSRVIGGSARGEDVFGTAQLPT